MDLGLKGKTAMVAGASKGLGFAVARILASEGSHVSIASRDTTAIQTAKSRIEKDSGSTVFACTADVRSADSIDRWRDDTLREFGGVDMMFVNSGGPPAGTFLSLDDKTWLDAVDLLLMSAVRMARGVIPHMKARGGGSIVFSTSTSVKEPVDNLVLSSVVRVAIPGLAKTLAREFAADRIRVNNLIPGRINTDRLKELDEFGAKKKGISVEDQKKAIVSQIPLGRYGEPDEYARAAVFILSPAASYITGASLLVDGGMLKGIT